MTPRVFIPAVGGPKHDDKPVLPESKSLETQLTARNESIILIELSSSKRLEFSEGVVILYDPLGATDVSTSSSPESKILALESLHDLLRLQERGDLDPNTESPVVNSIIGTFRSKLECLQAINQYVSVTEHRQILANWATDVWGQDDHGNLAKSDLDNESHADSLFSDADVQEISENRVRPITLRPRKSSQQTFTATVTKTEIDTTFQPHPSDIKTPKEVHILPPPPSLRHVRRRSPPRSIRERSPGSRHPVRPSIRSRTQSSPTVRHHKSNQPEDVDGRSQTTNKRALPMRENITPEEHRVKRAKSIDVISDGKAFLAKSFPQKSITTESEPTSLTQALNMDSSKSEELDLTTPLSSAESVSRCWREITSKFPEEVKMLPTIDRLAYYFREAELAKKENEILKRDESERRKSMMLMAEKIKLMNQPVSRSCASGDSM